MVLSSFPLDPAVAFSNYSMVAALVVLLWEYFITFQDECRYIWKKPMNTVKCIYLYSRYSAIILQLCNFIIMSHPSARVPIRSDLCRKWFTIHSVFLYLFSACFDIVLMLRVYALYKRQLKVGVFLVALFISQGVGVFICVYMTLHRDSFDNNCDISGTPFESVLLGASTVVTQAIIWSMTIAKRGLPYERVPVIRVVRRDGHWSFAIVLAMILMNIPYACVKDLTRTSLVIFWPECFYSISACRVVLNMQSIKSASESQSPTIDLNSVQFTSNISLSTLNQVEDCNIGS